MSRVELVESVDVDATVDVVWDALTDAHAQSEWMLLTRVHGTAQGGKGVGGRLEAVTGLGPVGFTDRMTVTTWDPPKRWTVAHTGGVVRGTGDFEVVDLGGGRSRFVWGERLDLPLGRLGRAGWVLVRPVARWGLRLSLRRFRRVVEAGHETAR